MENIQLFITTVLMGFFAIMNPLGNTPVFLSMTNGFDSKEKKAIALKTALISFVVVAIFILLGNAIFKAFDITLYAFRIAGGLLITRAGFELLSSGGAKSHAPSEDIDRSAKSITEIAISPLAIPLIAGPGTIATAINFTGLYPSWKGTLGILGILGFVCLLLYILFMFSDRLVKYLGRDVMNVTSRLMGLIIAVMGVQMIISGVREVWKTF